jgi:hypothetical protein
VAVERDAEEAVLELLGLARMQELKEAGGTLRGARLLLTGDKKNDEMQ